MIWLENWGQWENFGKVKEGKCLLFLVRSSSFSYTHPLLSHYGPIKYTSKTQCP
jgi:hypothetical protein